MCYVVVWSICAQVLVACVHALTKKKVKVRLIRQINTRVLSPWYDMVHIAVFSHTCVGEVVFGVDNLSPTTARYAIRSSASEAQN